MLKLHPLVAAAGLCLLTAGTGLASDLKLDGQVSLQKPIGRHVQISLTGTANLPALLAMDLSPGPVLFAGERLALGMTPAVWLLPATSTDGTGLALVTLQIPNAPAFVGFAPHFLGVILDPADPNGLDFSSGASLVVTDGGQARIPGGTFVMGDHHGVGDSDEKPLHSVTLDPFYMDLYETTNDAYTAYLNAALSQGLIEVSVSGHVSKAGGGVLYFNTDTAIATSRIVWSGTAFSVEAGKGDHPVSEVSWYGAAAFANWRSAQDGLAPCYDLGTWSCDFSADGHRLPTEAEWEYAARGGEHAPYYKYPWDNSLDGSRVNAAFSGDPFETTLPQTSPVGYFDGGQTPNGVDRANGYGLYDVSGNVWEWCHDWYTSDYYASSPPSNPTGPASGLNRVRRGGSYFDAAAALRSAERTGSTPDFRYEFLGFRLARGSHTEAGHHPL